MSKGFTSFIHRGKTKINKHVFRFGVVTAVAALGMLAEPVFGQGVVLWNKLGSASEVTNSGIGPNGVIQQGTPSILYGPVQFGSGINVQGTYGDRNPTAVTFDRSSIASFSGNKGTMAFWVKPNHDSNYTGIARWIGSGNSPEFSPDVYWRGWEKRIWFQICAQPFGCDISAVVSVTNAMFAFRAGDVFHVALVWDREGIDGTSDTIRAYINGTFYGAATRSWYRDLPIGEVKLGNHDYAQLAEIDNLVVWDYAKTDFSDRLNEDPTILQPLHATPVSPAAIRLTWDDNSTTEMGFRIQSKEGDCTSSNPWTTRADLRPDNEGDKATFVDTNLLAATPYAYQVSTYFGANNFSAYSECASASTGAPGTPHIPRKLEAYSRSNTRVDLFWEDASNDETEFTIYRQVGSGSWSLLNTVAENIQSYSDPTATGNDTTTSYHYDVSACNASGCSEPITSSPVVPFRPGNLAATVASTVKLTWKDKSSNESGFEIQRKNGDCTSEYPWVLAQKVAANINTYNDKRAVPATVYSYRVRAYYTSDGIPRGYGYSGFTGCASAIAP